MKINRTFVYGMLVVPVVAAAITIAVASNVTIPTTFAPNTPAVAAQVNANFTAVKTAVDDNDTRITALENLGSLLAIAHFERDGTTVNKFFNGIAATVTIMRVGGFPTGTYEVDFGTDITACWYLCSLGDEVLGFGSVGRSIYAEPRLGNPNALFVQVFDAAGALIDGDFTVAIY